MTRQANTQNPLGPEGVHLTSPMYPDIQIRLILQPVRPEIRR
jgi:hypothetical protein